jgi:hypothetical protein
MVRPVRFLPLGAGEFKAIAGGLPTSTLLFDDDQSLLLKDREDAADLSGGVAGLPGEQRNAGVHVVTLVVGRGPP